MKVPANFRRYVGPISGLLPAARAHIDAQRLDVAARRVENRASLGLVAVLGLACALHLSGCTTERHAAPVARRVPKGCLKFYDRETLPAKPVGAN